MSTWKYLKKVGIKMDAFQLYLLMNSFVIGIFHKKIITYVIQMKSFEVFFFGQLYYFW